MRGKVDEPARTCRRDRAAGRRKHVAGEAHRRGPHLLCEQVLEQRATLASRERLDAGQGPTQLGIVVEQAGDTEQLVLDRLDFIAVAVEFLRGPAPRSRDLGPRTARCESAVGLGLSIRDAVLRDRSTSATRPATAWKQLCGALRRASRSVTSETVSGAGLVLRADRRGSHGGVDSAIAGLGRRAPDAAHREVLERTSEGDEARSCSSARSDPLSSAAPQWSPPCITADQFAHTQTARFGFGRGDRFDDQAVMVAFVRARSQRRAPNRADDVTTSSADRLDDVVAHLGASSPSSTSRSRATIRSYSHRRE